MRGGHVVPSTRHLWVVCVRKLGRGERLRLTLSHPWSNPYEAPGCQEAHDSCERNLLHFFTLAMPAFASVR
jgi:hypothetical protein